MNTHLATLITSLAPEAGKELLEAYGAAALDTLVVAVIEALPEDKVNEFYRIAKIHDPEAAGDFLHEAIPDLDDLLAEEIERFKREADGLAAL